MASAKAGRVMGGKRYRDEPGLEAADDGQDALSLRSQPGQSNQVPIEFDDTDLDRQFQDEDGIPDVLGQPPAYTDDVDVQLPFEGEAPDENPHLFTPITNKNGVDILMDARFDTDPAYMEDCLKRWARTPPLQLIRILGTHTQTVTKDKKQTTETVTDFDIKVRMTEYLFNKQGTSSWAQTVTAENMDKTYRGTVLRKRAIQKSDGLESGKPNLTEWCHRYCAAHTPVKTFRLTREVTGLDTEYLSERITSMIKNTNYRGKIQVSFPIENRAVDVYSTSWQNRWRLKTWIAMLFYISFLWIFTWPYLFFATKKFHVLRIEWPYSRPADNDGSGPGAGNQIYATLSEKNWYQRWSKVLENNVLNKRQGVLTEEDLANPVALQTGNANVDTAVNLFGAGLRAFGEVNRQLGWGGNC